MEDKNFEPITFSFNANIIDASYVDDKVMAFCKEVAECIELYVKKNHDYGDSFNKNMKILGNSYAVGKLLDKMNRLIAIHDKEEERQVSDETLDDTLRDMANYALMTLAFIHNNSEENK